MLAAALGRPFFVALGHFQCNVRFFSYSLVLHYKPFIGKREYTFYIVIFDLFNYASNIPFPVQA